MEPSPDSPSAEAFESEQHSLDAKPAGSHHAGLYILPALIVLVFVIGWLFVFWLLHEDQDPQSLIQGMQQPGRRSWQKAYALSQLLLDPDYDHLKDDAQLCRALQETLVQQNRDAAQAREAGKQPDEELARFRAFLCRALGEFRLLDALPTLSQSASAQTTASTADSHQRKVRLAAIEGIAVLASNVGPEQIQADRETVAILVEASWDTGSAHATGPDSDIASAATFALGVIGGPQATEQLLQLIGDTRTDVRYNAATGLARQGRDEAVATLLEMLDPDNQAACQHEKSESARARKQWMVLNNGIQAAVRLLPTASSVHREQLTAALQRLSDSQTVAARIRIDAQQALLKLKAEPRRNDTSGVPPSR